MFRPLIALLALASTAALADDRVFLDARTTCGLSGFRIALLQRVNEARGRGAVCGSDRMAAAPDLGWDHALFSAAARHSADMAARNYFAHEAPDGRRVAQRVTAEGYRWRTVGENIAGGDTSAEAVVAGWLASPGHCRNLLNPAFEAFAVACVARPGSRWGTYWTMVLAGRKP